MQTTDTDEHGGRRAALVWAAIVLVYLVLRVPLLDVPLDRDEGLFGWIGQSILRGDMPYRDVFEHKPPGVFLIYAAALLVVPPTAAGVHMLLLVWNFATLLVTSAVARKLGGRQAGLWAAFVFAVVSAAPSVQGFAATTEMFLLLPLIGSVRFALVAMDEEDTRRRVRHLLVCGACAAAACWIKQSAFVALLIVPVTVGWPRPERGTSVARLGWTLLGGAALSAAVVAPFAALGVLGEFWYWSFTHSAIYGAWSWDVVGAAGWRAGLRDMTRELLPALGVPFVMTRMPTAVMRAEPGGRWAAAFLLLSIASALHSAFLYPHYFAQLVPALAIAAGLGAAAAVTRFAENRRARSAKDRRMVPTVLLVALTIGVPVVAAPRLWLLPDPVAVSIGVLGPQTFETSPLLAADLRERTGPDDRVMIFGSEPQILFLAERRAANPYGMIYPLTGPYPRAREFQERLLADLVADPPLLILYPQIEATLQRTPDTDPLLEQGLWELVEARYRLDGLLMRGSDGAWTILRNVTPAIRDSRRADIYCVIYRRSDD